MHERRVNDAVDLGVILNIVIVPERVMFVPVAQDALAPVVPAVEFGVPLPMMLIPIPDGTVIPEVQEQVPDGILIVSPLTALWVGPLMTAFTSASWQEAAVTVDPALCARTVGPHKARKRNRKIAGDQLAILNTFGPTFRNHSTIASLYYGLKETEIYWPEGRGNV